VKPKHPYVGFARVYDEIMFDVPYSQWLKYIEAIWSFHSFSPNTVLDLACGTGNMALCLAKHGYTVTGVDSSNHMLDVARKKAGQEGLFISFIHQDMRTLKTDCVFDAVVCVFDSLNYLLKPSDIKSCFRSVFQAVRPGGYFVFDVNTPFRLSTIARDTSVFNGDWYFVVWRDFWDARNKWWQVNLTGFIKDDGQWCRFDEIHRERAFPTEYIAEWLEEAGFIVEGIYEPNSMRPASDTTLRAYFAARKPGG
jgi:ubiquinone/menaquinone biosynthesis C-methylase UbiE